jgi:DNA-directed RNA polymerase alpha subunit
MSATSRSGKSRVIAFPHFGMKPLEEIIEKLERYFNPLTVYI